MKKKIPGIITDSQCSFNVNIHSEKSHITYVTETKCISIPNVISDQTLATYNSIKEVGSHSSKISGISKKSVDCMCKVKKNSKVSPKCGTTKWSVKMPAHDTEKYGLDSESVAQKTATKGFPAASIPSPWSTRKGNSLLSKRRRVSAKEIGCGDNDGWLLHRFRSSGAGATWLNMWFILKGVTFYGFKTPQATKAHVMIVLPGFTVSVAEEVKSRSFAFKIYHTGTVFYFSADTADDFSVWLACLSVAATPQKSIKTCSGFNSQTPYFSETDDDLESQKESESETSIYKHFSYKFEHGSSSQQHGKGHQTSITESNKTDSPKLFGSRNKIARKSETMGPTMCTELLEPASSSLDRKYLNFLGGIRNSNVPVPTAQFRSYRRAPKKNPMEESKLHEGKSYQIFDNICLPMRNDKLTSSFVKSDTQDMPINNLKCSTVHTEDLLLAPQDVLLSEGNRSFNRSGISTEQSDSFVTKHKIDMHLKVESKEKTIRQSHKLLNVHNVRSHHIHASNPNLHLSSNMFNYRLAAERLRKFGLGNNQQEGTSGFVTLENLMSRQEEEKCKQQQLNLNSMSSDGFTNISSHHFLDPTHANLVKDNGHKLKDFEVSGSSGVPCETKIYNEKPAVPACKKGNFINMQQYSNPPQDIRVNSSIKHASSTLAQNSALAVHKVVSKLETNSAISSNRKKTNLKSAAQYHPPPISKVLAGGRKVHPKEDGPKMKLAFEMYLGENTLSAAPNKDTFCKSSKFRNLFLFSRNQNVKYPHGDTSVSVCGEQRKQLLGSPRLHRTFPWEKPVYGSKKTPNVFNFNPVTHPSFSLVPPSWTTDLSDLQSDCSIPQVKPMMEVAMICKKPCKVVMASSSSPQSSSAPDYPGLEYPPVFEPETYTLSDANTLLKSRHHPCANDISCACSTLSNNQTKKEQ